MHPAAIDRFPSLTDLSGVAHLFTTRLTPGAPGRYAADADHAPLGLPAQTWRFAEQTHGNGTAIVTGASPRVSPGVDALCTSEPGLALGVYTADCAAVYVVDPARRVIGLAHSGRKGTEGRVLVQLIDTMRSAFGCDPAELVVQLSPCIRPPRYEVDFAADIRAQARAAGVREVHDCGICTAANPGRYFSYRAEQGKTGRMLAALVLA
jgi:hypothetical protein